MRYPRAIALRVLTEVLSNRGALDQALNASFSEVAAEARPWLQEVCSGTLRWKGRLDLAVDSAALKKKPSGWLRKILLLAAYQLVGQERTSPGAVVSETVDEVKRKEGVAPAKFANALLRKIADHAAEWRAAPFPTGAPVDQQAAWASLPSWLWSALVSERGEAWTREFAEACLRRPEIWVRGRPGFRPEWAAQGPLPEAWKVSEGGAIPAKEGFADGQFIVQDISSQVLIAEVLKEARALEPGIVTALDLCAAPGGKSVGLAWSGLRVTATDRDERRLSLLRQTVERTTAEVGVVDREAVAGLPSQDLVWVDAPCMGTGIIRRHPDVRWVRQEKELKGLQELQQALLREAWERVRPGGFLAYSVCSVLQAEGPGAIAQADLRSHQLKEWSFSPQQEPFGDGFWGALLRKPGSTT